LRCEFTSRYAIDGASEDLEIGELRPLLKIDDNANRTDAINDVLPAFKYLEEILLPLIYPAPV
jgi:hypothetical protein